MAGNGDREVQTTQLTVRVPPPGLPEVVEHRSAACVPLSLSTASIGLVTMSIPSTAARTVCTSPTTADSADGGGRDAVTAGSGRDKRLDLGGIFPPIATPFDRDENIDYKKLDFNLRRWNEIPFKGNRSLVNTR